MLSALRTLRAASSLPLPEQSSCLGLAQRRLKSDIPYDAFVTLTIPPQWLNHKFGYLAAQTALTVSSSSRFSPINPIFDDFVWAFASVTNMFATGNGDALRAACAPQFVKLLEDLSLFPTNAPAPGSVFANGIDLGPIEIFPEFLSMYISPEAKTLRPFRIDVLANFSFEYPDLHGNRVKLAEPISAVFQSNSIEPDFKLLHIDFHTEHARNFWQAIWPNPHQLVSFFSK